jgi:DNA-binding ferritin-like protein
MAIFPDNMTSLTPEGIASSLFSLRDRVHKAHLDTKSFSEHKMLDKLYNGISEITDRVLETLMGYVKRRIGQIKVDVKQSTVEGLLEDISTFAYSLEEWAERNEYGALNNMAQELEELCYSSKYLLTLK